MKTLAGKVAFITGGASGLGRSMARSMAARGARIALADINEAALQQTAAELRNGGATVEPIVLDVANAAAWAAAADATERSLGPVDVLCSNAGVVGTRKPLAELQPQAWQWVIDVNLNSVFHSMHTFVPRMRARGEEAHVLATASMGGLIAQPSNSAYAAAKAGVIATCEALRDELAGTNVSVSVLCPGLVATSLHETSIRNAPDALRAETGIEPELLTLMRQSTPADVVGEIVAKGILENRFWIFSHPEIRPIVQARFDEILANMV